MANCNNYQIPKEYGYKEYSYDEIQNDQTAQTHYTKQDITKKDAIGQVKNLKARIVMVALVVFALIVITILTILTHGTILPLIGHHIMPLVQPLSHGFLPAIKNFIEHHIGLTLILICGIFVLIDLTKQKNRLEEKYELSSDETFMNLQDLLSEISEHFQQVTERLRSLIFRGMREEDPPVFRGMREEDPPAILIKQLDTERNLENLKSSTPPFFNLSTNQKNHESVNASETPKSQSEVTIETIPNKNCTIPKDPESKVIQIKKLDNDFCIQEFEKTYEKKFNWSYSYQYESFYNNLKLQQIEHQPELLKSENNTGLGKIGSHWLIKEKQLESLIKKHGLRILFYYAREENREEILDVATKYLNQSTLLQELYKNPSNLNNVLSDLYSQATKLTSTNNEANQEDVNGVYRLLVQALIYQHPEFLSLIKHSDTLTSLCKEKEFLESLVNVHGLYILCYINNDQSLQLAKKYKAAFQFSYENHKTEIKQAFISSNEKNMHMPHTDNQNPFFSILDNKQDSMQIFFKGFDGNTLALNVYPETKIEEVVFLLHEKHDLSKSLRMNYNAKTLETGNLSKNQVNTLATVHITRISNKNWRLNFDT